MRATYIMDTEGAEKQTQIIPERDNGLCIWCGMLKRCHLDTCETEMQWENEKYDWYPDIRLGR